MRSISLLTLMLFLYCFSAVAQVNKAPVENAGTYFNGFQNSENIDSLMYFSRKLAANPRYSGILQDLLNNEFAQEFIRSEPLTTDAAKREKAFIRLKRSKLLLNRMAFDTSKVLAKAVQPLFFWTQVQDSENNTEQQRKLTNAFLSAGLAEGDVYQNRAGRYAILIWQLISKKPELKVLSNGLFDSVSRQLKDNQVTIGLDTASRLALDKRAWYRYLYAYCSNVRAKGLSKQGNAREAETLYKTAFDYSPDLTDRNHQSAYFYDAIFLTGDEKIPFQEDYLQFVMGGQGNKNETLKALLTVALTDPVYKGRLKEFYNANFKGQLDFNSFWINSINAGAKDGPIFSLNRMDGSAFSIKENKGKWLLIDFWGTWCGPCRKEHPELQKFYQSVSNDPTSNVVVMTIACRDTRAKVDSYMTENKYNFPVAMADNTVEKVCNIQGYPSKLLISPQGKYLLIPYGTDWVGFIKGYSSL